MSWISPLLHCNDITMDYCKINAIIWRLNFLAHLAFDISLPNQRCRYLCIYKGMNKKLYKTKFTVVQLFSYMSVLRSCFLIYQLFRSCFLIYQLLCSCFPIYQLFRSYFLIYQLFRSCFLIYQLFLSYFLI